MNTTTKKRVAIVTGASSGMGLGITQALLQHGYRVVANSRNISKSKDLKPSSDLILVDGDISKMDTGIRHFECPTPPSNTLIALIFWPTALASTSRSRSLTIHFRTLN
jgi:NAD(P)-dependent dehydrogenase (short-subunit alcohol dehydrogenase family)